MNTLPALWSLGMGRLLAFAQGVAASPDPASGAIPGALPGAIPGADAVAWGGAGLSTIVAVLVMLDRFGFLKRPSEKIEGPRAATPPAAPPPAPPGLTHADLMAEIKQVAARMGAAEDTLKRIDERSREQPVAIARLEGKIESWEGRLERIEDLLLSKGPPKMRNTG